MVHADDPTDDPRLSYPTLYRNVRPDVHYVGDEACAECHPTQAETYRRHPMGRSLAPMAARAGEGRYDPAVKDPFEAGGFQFSIERAGDHVFHKEVRRDPQGKTITEQQSDIDFEVGSGEHGHSYLINREGYVFESPVTWFTQKNRWDLSPGYTADMHTDRQIQPGCLFCHCNKAEPVPHTVNRYRLPLFQGCTIGCERCHGPGALHVARREAATAIEGRDDTIVNPRHLEPALRESVCQQCHLNGEARITRRNRQPFDFRPGLPLYLFWSIYVARPGFHDETKSVGHVSQMFDSRCYQASSGKLGCISCHDPHFLPEPKEKAAYYRARCLSCHEQAGCSLPAARRQEKQNDCTACHMPRFGSSDIAHTAFTDHRVLRRLTPAGKGSDAQQIGPGEAPIVHFHQALLDLPPGEAARDLGVALVELARTKYLGAQGMLAAQALPLLESAVQTWPDDVAAAEARGFALWLTGQKQEALAAYEGVLTRIPQREVSLLDAGHFSALLGRNDEAVSYMRRVIKVDPWPARYHQFLGTLLASGQQWPEALEESKRALELNPANLEARRLLIVCHLRNGANDKARREFDKLMALDPPEPEKIRRWFDEQIR